eukprot:m.825 g.825  ORF g.825 m.825 type:complete len:166 (-) comp1344_c0_seq1:112-609(-)
MDPLAVLVANQYKLNFIRLASDIIEVLDLTGTVESPDVIRALDDFRSQHPYPWLVKTIDSRTCISFGIKRSKQRRRLSFRVSEPSTISPAPTVLKQFVDALLGTHTKALNELDDRQHPQLAAGEVVFSSASLPAYPGRLLPTADYAARCFASDDDVPDMDIGTDR